jgi:hypothetical protein
MVDDSNYYTIYYTSYHTTLVDDHPNYHTINPPMVDDRHYTGHHTATYPYHTTLVDEYY